MATRKEIQLNISEKGCHEVISHSIHAQTKKGKKIITGYSKICRTLNGKRYRLAHRYFYALKHGEIPDGLFVCHKCDNRKCVNVAHLFLGTQKDNILDMDKKGRRVNSPLFGERHSGTKISKEQAIEIRILGKSFTGKSTMSHRKIAKIYKLRQTTISNIVSGRTWKELK